MVATMATGCGSSSGETTTTDNAASTTTDAAAPATEASDTADAVTDAAGGDYADKKVGVCIYQFTDYFMALFRTELENYLVEQGFSKDNITIVDGANDQATQTGQIDNFISINNIVDVDLFGQMNAESAGIKQISGAGGQLDFVLGAYLSKGGKSFICCSSTFKKKDGTLESRIRPTLENGSVVTDARPCAHWFVTEYGKVNLKGLTAWQRAEALISVAHPDFREQLIQEAEKMRIWKRSNKR